MKRSNIMKILNDVIKSCSEKGWDGYTAEPVSEATICNARLLISVLPHDIPTPEISAEPDGHITLEWYRSPNVLSISISPENLIHYAALIDSSKKFGTETFKGVFPEQIFKILKSLKDGLNV
jgi:hypothetical protein